MKRGDRVKFLGDPNIQGTVTAVHVTVAVVWDGETHPTMQLSEDIEAPLVDFVVPIGLSLDEVVRRYTLQVVDKCEGNMTEAARILGCNRRSVYRRLGPDWDKLTRPKLYSAEESRRRRAA